MKKVIKRWTGRSVKQVPINQEIDRLVVVCPKLKGTRQEWLSENWPPKPVTITIETEDTE